MNTLHHTITIQAPRAQVAKTMLYSPTYEQWTSIFDPTSRYEGSWDEGSTIRFLSTDPETRTIQGMLARVKEHRPGEFVSIEHYGMVSGEAEIPYNDGEPGYENYTFSDAGEGTRVDVEMTNVPEEYVAMFNEQWPRALLKLKEIIENSTTR